MIHINLGSLCHIINKIREFQAQDEVMLPDVPVNLPEDWALDILADHSEDRTLQEMTHVIGAMSERQRAELVALMWLGRGDYDLDKWETAVDDAIGDYSLNAASYVLAHPMAADDLEEGLIAHGYSCQD